MGPSPIIITKDMLARVARPWWDMSLRMKGHRDANRVFGWVLEMWAYNLAARNMGIRHTVSQSLQVEPQGTVTQWCTPSSQWCNPPPPPCAGRAAGHLTVVYPLLTVV